LRLSTPILTASVLLAAYAIATGTVSIHYVATGSMEPSIPAGSLVVAVRDERFYQGDVVVYAMAGSGYKLMHRVVEVGVDGLLVTADAQPGYVEHVGWERVQGKVVLAIPFLGFLYMGSAVIPLAFLTLILLLLPTGGRDVSLFWPSAFSVVAMAVAGDTGLVSLGRYAATFLASATAVGCRALETSDGRTRRLVQLCYALLMVACLSSISRQAILRGVGL